MNTSRTKLETMETGIEGTIWISLMPNRKERRERKRNRVRENSYMTYHIKDKAERVVSFLKKRASNLAKNMRKDLVIKTK